MRSPRLVCVMGVAGCGKSTIGQGIAAGLGAAFLEADALHPPSNIAKMSAGTPLTDEDRWPWLDAIAAAAPKAGRAVIACSALRRAYRERLAAGAGEPIFFVHLTGSREEIARRMTLRTGHFMPAALLDSQFATLEPPGADEPHLALDVALPAETLIEKALENPMTDILMIAPMHPVCMEEIARLGTVHRLWEAEDRAAFLREVGPKVEIVATDGHWGCPPALMAELPALKLISSYGVGYDNINVPAANARSVRVTNTPDVLNDAMAEITVGLMIALARRIPEAEAYTRRGDWAAKGNFPLTAELTGATAGIVGLGQIGKEIARRLVAMKMEVVYHGRSEQPGQPFRYFASLTEMAKAADWLVVITPGGPETRKLVNAEVLASLGPEGRLVNVSRGAVVDEAALVEALKSGALGGAALDVFEDEPRPHPDLLTMPNTVLSPHQGSATVRTRAAMGQLVVDNIKAHLAGKPLLTEVTG